MRLVGSSTLGAFIFFSLSAVSQSSASCLNPPVNAEAISRFKSDTQGLVAPDSDTRTIEAITRDLAATDALLAGDLVKVAARAAPRFRTAIAAGLAQAAIACQSIDQKSALLIQEAVAGYADGQFQASFAAVTGDISTAATEAASASAAGSAGSVEANNPNGSSSPGTSQGGVTGSSGSAGGVTTLSLISAELDSSAQAAAITAADPVSPTR